MVARAQQIYPAIEFREGDAEDLQGFDADSFDAAAMNFGILHLSQPEKALRAMYRLLKPGGHVAFTAWAAPEVAVGYSFILKAIEKFGDPSLTLPPAPPFFHFSDPDNCRRVLTECGFTAPVVRTVHQVWALDDPEEIFDSFFHGSARTGGLLRLQAKERLTEIRNEISRAAKVYLNNEKVLIPMPALLAWAVKPQQ